jgi:hypothetical protein
VRSLGWKILQREFGKQREGIVSAIMSPSTEADTRIEMVLRQSGADEVLQWPRRQIEIHQAEHGPQTWRAGIGVVAGEEQ